MSDQYENQQQRIDRLEAQVGPCREDFMNDEAYLEKLESLVGSKPSPKPKAQPKKPLFKSNKKK